MNFRKETLKLKPKSAPCNFFNVMYNSKTWSITSIPQFISFELSMTRGKGKMMSKWFHHIFWAQLNIKIICCWASFLYVTFTKGACFKVGEDYSYDCIRMFFDILMHFLRVSELNIIFYCLKIGTCPKEMCTEYFDITSLKS